MVEPGVAQWIRIRAYTASCRVLAGMSGAKECWHHDSNPTFNSGFYARNNILFTREN